MPEFTDQLGRTVELPSVPRRIVSLVPSQTELLFDLGLDEEIVGVTRFCVRPADRTRLRLKVGGTKDVRPDRIEGLAPDLILANREENEREAIEALAARYPVWVSDVADLDDACAMIEAVGEVVDRPEAAEFLVATIRRRFARLTPLIGLRVAYLIWREPWMVAGGGTFIDAMLRSIGLVNHFAGRPRYPQIDAAELRDVDCVLLSSEPYPFRSKHVGELRQALAPIRVEWVDGEIFSWYGSRLREAPDYLRALQKRLKEHHRHERQ